jgi:hypothetical protein
MSDFLELQFNRRFLMACNHIKQETSSAVKTDEVKLAKSKSRREDTDVKFNSIFLTTIFTQLTIDLTDERRLFSLHVCK